MALISVDEDSWLIEFANLERLSQDIQRQITSRDSMNSTSGIWFIPDFPKVLSAYRLCESFVRRVQQDFSKDSHTA